MGPSKLPAPYRSDAKIGLMPTLAAVLESELSADTAEDSRNFLPVLTGKSDELPRMTHVHNTKVNHYAICHSDLVLIDSANGYVSGRNKVGRPPAITHPASTLPASNSSI